MNSQPQGDVAKSAPPQPQPAKEIIKPKEKEIVVPKKKIKEKEPAPKKEAVKQPEEVKPQPVPAHPAPAQAAPAQSQTQTKNTVAPTGYSGSISVDTAKFPYAYYTNQIVRKINRYWQWSNEFGKLKTVVFFKISRDGSVNSETIKDSSGDSLFDDQALRAVTMASPFPPLPDGYPDNDLGVYFEFTFKE
jgi:protein TonB